MTPAVIDRWLEVFEGGRTDLLENLLAEDAIFYSPAVFAAQEGRAKTATYLRAAEKMFAGKDFRYVGQWHADRSAVL